MRCPEKRKIHQRMGSRYVVQCDQDDLNKLVSSFLEILAQCSVTLFVNKKMGHKSVPSALLLCL